MKTIALVLSLLVQDPPPGNGQQLYAQGRFADAAAAFAQELATGESAELQFNLALARWRAGDLAGAEQAAEKYAVLAPRPRADLHYGLLGAVRYASDPFGDDRLVESERRATLGRSTGSRSEESHG